jgi:hypothetical protein
MKRKSFLSVCFFVSLLPMLLNQYGAAKGVQEITGLINLLNPIGIVSVLMFLMSILCDFKKQIAGKILGAAGVIGIVVSEIYSFLTWHILTITGKMSLQHSINLAFPEFYFGLGVSLVMVFVYFVINKNVHHKGN